MERSGCTKYTIRNGNIKDLEVTQNKVARMGLGANRTTAVEALRGDMGWSSFEERIHKGKLKYWARLYHMHESRWPKKIWNWKRGLGKFGMECEKLKHKYKIKILRQNRPEEIHINNKKINNVYTSLKKGIENIIKLRGLVIWQENMDTKDSLRYYKNKEKSHKESFYNGDWGGKLLFKARSDTLELNSKQTWRGHGRECQRCSTGNQLTEETLEHFLTECEWYTDERSVLIRELQEIDGELWDSEREGEDKGIPYILGLKGGNCNRIVISTKQFLCKAWEKRKSGGRFMGGNQDHNYFNINI